MKHAPLIALLALFACDDGESDATPAPDLGRAADAALDPDAADAPDPDAGEDPPDPDAGTPDAAEPDAAPRDPDVCDDLGLPRRAFQAGAGLNFGDIAGDFRVTTIQGSYALSEAWTGCESFVFLVYIPDLRAQPGPGWAGDGLWNSDVLPLLERKPANTRYFFVSMEADAAARRARMEAMEAKIGRLPGPFPKGVHFVLDRLQDIDGSVGEFARDYLSYATNPASREDLGDRGQAPPPLPFVFGIDRLQRWDSGGSMSEVVGRPEIWKMAGYLGPFYDHIARMYDAPPGDATVTLLEGRVSERIFVRTVELPDADTMATMGELAFDVSVTCPHRNVFACSEWDRIAAIQLCADPECAERREVARWITPYWRRGERRWRIDATPFLGELRAGGAQTFRVEMGPGWERATERDVRIVAHFDAGDRQAQRADLAFTGGGFGAEYNDRDPFMFTPAPGATRVELVVILSGHGQTMADNCAEWCDHRHDFAINDEALPTITHTGEIGSSAGCGEFAGAGVSPGQFGNWAPERAFWCPGLPVQPIRIDLTAWVDLSGPNELTYRATLGAATLPRGGDIALSAYVVSYRDD